MSGARFGSEWTGDGDSGFDLSISGDGQAFTLTFAEIQADVDGGKAPDLTAARVFSAVVPVHGDGNEVSIAFTAQGFAFASDGADQGFEQQLIVKGVPTSLCHLAVVAVVQRDPAHADAAAVLRPSSVDAEIQASS